MKLFRFKTAKDKLISVILILLILVFAVSAFIYGKNTISGRSQQNAFDELKELVETGSETAAPSEDNETGERQMLSGYSALYERNSDFAGWIKAEGTKIDYPVMCTPEDPNFYLRRAFDGSSASAGTPFIGVDSDAYSDCVIIHGHNMNNKTMFGTLDSYRDRSFWETHPTFMFDSLYEHREYRIFAAVQCEVIEAGKTGFKYYESGGELDSEQYEELADWLISNSFYDTGVVPDGAQIVILSTCSYQNDNGRFVVAGYRVK